MKTTFSICNSIRASHNPVFTITPVKKKRESDPSVSFSYNHAAPSYPGDVMPETSKQIQVGEGEGDSHLYVLTATGTVDDQATISVAGQSYTSPSGAGVEINGSFSNIKAGFYTVSVSHTNIDYPPKGNISFLNCTVGPASAISIIPDKNDPPQECDCDCPPCSCNSDGATSPGGLSPSGPARNHPALRRFSSNLTSTSGGSGVTRQSSVHDMAWSAQFGVFRGMSHMPSGRLEILAHRAFSPDLFSPAGLALRHPLATSLALPAESIAPNTMLALLDGASYTNYMLDGTGNVFFPVGASGITTTILAPVSSMNREASAACSLDQAVYIRASYADGSAAFYSLSTGQCEGYISSGGYLLTAAEAENYLAILRDEHGVIRQIWNTWDGLADVLPLEEGGYAISIYAPSQVMEPEEEGALFTTEGTPVKIFTVTGDEAQQTLVISERDNTLPSSMPDFVTTWTWAGEAWSMAEGTGEDAVETRRERLQPEAASQENRYRVLTRLMKNGVEAACTLEEYETTTTGEHLLSRTEGYRGYLQIAALDLTRTTLNALWYILWDPAEPVATRPLAIQTAGNWFAYGWDLTKTIMELYDSTGHISTSYNYTPFGNVTSTGSISQPLQWSSEMFDAESGLVYYNYRHYNPYDGRWTSRDPIGIEGGYNLYAFIENKILGNFDYLGFKGYKSCTLTAGIAVEKGKFIRRTCLGDEHVPIRRKCYFRCYHNKPNNCYNIPCWPWCQKDHGIEILITTVSTKFDIPAPYCTAQLARVTSGELKSGDVVKI